MPRTTSSRFTAEQAAQVFELRQIGTSWRRTQELAGLATFAAAWDAHIVGARLAGQAPNIDRRSAREAARDARTYWEHPLVAHLPRPAQAGEPVAPVESAATPVEVLIADWFRFGVEIEVDGISITTAAAATQTALGRTVRAGGWHAAQAAGYREWSAERDSTVDAEVVSPILAGEAGLAEAVTVMDSLRAAGAQGTGRTGMHVHVDVSMLNADQLDTLIDWYTHGQSAINRLFRAGRSRSRWCQSLSASEVDNIKAAKRIGFRPAVDRYRSINPAHLLTRGSLEFRQHHGTVRSAEMRTWVRLLAAAVAAAAAGTLVAPPARTRSVDRLIESLSLPAATVTALRARVARSN